MGKLDRLADRGAHLVRQQPREISPGQGVADWCDGRIGAAGRRVAGSGGRIVARGESRQPARGRTRRACLRRSRTRRLIGAIATPWLIPWMLEVAREVTGRDLPDAHVPPSAIFLALVGCMLSWALYGAAFQLLAVGLFGASSGTTPSYIAAFTLSYLIGYLALFAPGGLGVRETVLAGLLVAAGLDVDPNATILVLFSRLWMTLLEAAPGLVLIALSRARPITATATATATTPNGSHA
jgi:hypothetical protein